jgi:diguanylate cyclase (GGDEF)-like protein
MNQRSADAPVVRAAQRGLSPLRLVLLGLLLVITAAATALAQRAVHQHHAARFGYVQEWVASRIAERMTAYVQVMRGAAGLFEASDVVTRDDFSRYVLSLRLTERYPGIRHMSFTPAVPAAELDAFIARVRAEPLPANLGNPALLREFTLRLPPPPITEVTTELHGPVLYITPLTPSNEQAIGVDMMRDAGRRSSMMAAKERGDAVLSPLIRLLRGEMTQVGFIAYLPVSHGTQWLGWTSTVFFAEDFMRGLLGDTAGPVEIAVHDGDARSPVTLLFSSAGLGTDGAPLPLPQATPAFQSETVLPLPGRNWTLHIRTRPGFVPLIDRLTPWIVGLGGLLTTLLLVMIDRARLAWQTQAGQLERSERAVRHQATHDPLTGLANRLLFMDRLDTALRRGERYGSHFALAYLDIDGFKPVNDQHGHQTGDALLKAIAGRLSATVRSVDTIARLGGDEFALILEDVTLPPTATLGLCRDVVARLHEPFDLVTAGGSTRIQVGASMGLAIYPHDGTTADALIAAADSTMYRAKRRGKNLCLMASECH